MGLRMFVGRCVLVDVVVFFFDVVVFLGRFVDFVGLVEVGVELLG